MARVGAGQPGLRVDAGGSGIDVADGTAKDADWAGKRTEVNRSSIIPQVGKTLLGFALWELR